MNHSFNVDVATDFGIEKAVILHNFYFWIKENKANNRNIYKGKAYTYNTSEAFAELFPYLKARKIAELLRQMEYDGLIESVQNKGINRVKSYTLTDKALEYYTTVHQIKEESNIQENDSPSYKNTTMEDTEIQHCSITDNKQTNINTDNSAKAPAKEKKSLLEREPKNDIEKVEKVYLQNYQALFNNGQMKMKNPVINWGASRKLTKNVIEKYGVDNIIKAVNIAKYDNFCLSGGYSLTTILSAGVLSRLINGSQKSSGTSFINNTDVDKLPDDAIIDF